MSKPPTPPENIEPKPEDDEQPEERLDFMLGPVENPDGTPLDPEETRRRLARQRYMLEQLAATLGCEIREVGQHPPSQQTPTAHANLIRQEAEPAMAKAAEETKAKGFHGSICAYEKHEGKDGKTTRFSLLDVQSFENISDILKSLPGIVKNSLPKGKIALGLKVGVLKLVALVKHDGEAKEEGD